MGNQTREFGNPYDGYGSDLNSKFKYSSHYQNFQDYQTKLNKDNNDEYNQDKRQIKFGTNQILNDEFSKSGNSNYYNNFGSRSNFNNDYSNYNNREFGNSNMSIQGNQQYTGSEFHGQNQYQDDLNKYNSSMYNQSRGKLIF